MQLSYFFLLFKLQYKGGIPSIGMRTEQTDASARKLHDLTGQRQAYTASVGARSKERYENLLCLRFGNNRTVIIDIDKDMLVCRAICTDMDASLLPANRLYRIFQNINQHLTDKTNKKVRAKAFAKQRISGNCRQKKSIR